MKEKLITFPLAKLAKEKGFNWKVRYSYGHPINPHIAYPNHDFAISCDFNSPNIGRNWKHLYSAPTQSILQTWLREEKDLFLTVDFRPDVETESSTVDAWTYKIVVQKGNLNFYTVKEYGTMYDSYEKALEEGLRIALNLIT